MIERWIDAWLTWLDQWRHLIAPDDCPEHVAHRRNPKICGRCGEHIDDLREDDHE